MTLGLDDSDMAGVEQRSFGQLGGDSLAAIQFARYVSELSGVNLPVSFVLDHSHSLQAIIDKVTALVRCGLDAAPLHLHVSFTEKSLGSCLRRQGSLASIGYNVRLLARHALRVPCCVHAW